MMEHNQKIRSFHEHAIKLKMHYQAVVPQKQTLFKNCQISVPKVLISLITLALKRSIYLCKNSPR